MSTVPACRSPLCLILPAQVPIWLDVSSKRDSTASVRRRAPSARSRACTSVAAVLAATARVSCAALAASSAPLAICSIERRSSSAADAASVIPAESSSVAAAIRSSIFCCWLLKILDGAGLGGASEAMSDSKLIATPSGAELPCPPLAQKSSSGILGRWPRAFWK